MNALQNTLQSMEEENVDDDDWYYNKILSLLIMSITGLVTVSLYL